MTKIAPTVEYHPVTEFLHSHHAVRVQKDLMFVTGEKGTVKRYLSYWKKTEES
jgi:hypothetical protein